MWPLTRLKKRHVVILVVFWIGLLITLYVLTQNTDAYEKAESFVMTDVRIEREIGTVHSVGFKFWDGFDFASTSDAGDANFTFDVTGVKGALVVQVHLKKVRGAWQVVRAHARVNQRLTEFDIVNS